MKKILIIILISEILNLILTIPYINLIVFILAIVYLVLLIRKILENKFGLNYIGELAILLLIIMPFNIIVEDTHVHKFIELLIIYGIIYIFVFPKLYERALKNKKLFRFIICLIIYIVTFGTINFYILEDASFIDSFWYACSTVTSVGYGDFVPTTILGKISGIIIMFGGLVIIAFLTTYIIEEFKRSVKNKNLSKSERIESLKRQKSDIEKEIKKLEE